MERPKMPLNLEHFLFRQGVSKKKKEKGKFHTTYVAIFLRVYYRWNVQKCL